jgi:hypothetical protein
MGGPGGKKGIRAGIAEAFASAWALLSDTDAYLSRSSAFAHYEGELKRLRAALTAAARNDEAQAEVRRAIVKLRKSLRLQGHDLSLGRLDVEIRGFRSDAALGEGFRRVVVFMAEGRSLAVAGEGNHIELAGRAEREALRLGIRPPYSVHYLWYRWTRNLLELSGADSETRQDFEELKTACAGPDARLGLIGAMKNLR